MGWLTPEAGILELVGEHYAPLYRFAYRLSGTSADAEDLTQETFCRAHANWKQLKDGSKARSWLFQILRNEYLQRVRSDTRRKVVGLDSAGELAAAGGTSSEFDISGDELQRALNELPESFRTPLILYFFDEFSYREIAEQLNVPMGTVMSRLSRAKAFLRERLEGAGEFAPPPEMELA